MDDLEVRQVVPVSEWPLALQGGLDGVERFADGAVAECVEVDLEACGVQRRDVAPSSSGSTKSRPVWAAGHPQPSR